MKTSVLALPGLVAVLLAAPATAQEEETCNHCGHPPECAPFEHWDNCGTGPGLEWFGRCPHGEGECEPLDCSLHGLDPCPGGEAPELAPEEIEEILLALQQEVGQEGNSLWLTRLVHSRRMELNPGRRVLYFRDCGGTALLGQIPVGPGLADRLLRLVLGA